METPTETVVPVTADIETDMPEDLGPHGRRAFALASRHVSSLVEADRFHDAVLRFARAIDLVEEVRAEWISYGRPKLFTHTNGAVVPHPLVKLLAESEKDAARAGRALKLEPEALKRATPGRPPGAGSASDRKAPPVVKLSTKKLDA